MSAVIGDKIYTDYAGAQAPEIGRTLDLIEKVYRHIMYLAPTD
ncbi:hypothetical protein FDG63_gp01 [Mycobacterium phage Marcell]|uniref:Uncharacterized protein n=1 Tax=Mycobacterium phage Marcell TaxID=2927990 RepID=K0GAR7_9CAUD|nr:hypothetical protein FDG63_gp01 [Mycobacterium phage Marcell]AFU20789.1 hypothetical protein MARCELL_1 [Mycobacterium phage Marcell]